MTSGFRYKNETTILDVQNENFIYAPQKYESYNIFENLYRRQRFSYFSDEYNPYYAFRCKAT